MFAIVFNTRTYVVVPGEWRSVRCWVRSFTLVAAVVCVLLQRMLVGEGHGACLRQQANQLDATRLQPKLASPHVPQLSLS